MPVLATTLITTKAPIGYTGSAGSAGATGFTGSAGTGGGGTSTGKSIVMAMVFG